MAVCEIPLTTEAASFVMSLTSPASTCCRSTPPPQVWNRLGAWPDWVSVVILALKASFSIGVTLIVTLGCCVWYASARACQTGSIGGVFAICHHSIVAGALGSTVGPPPPALSPLPLLLLHAPIPSTAAPAPRAPRNDRRG